MSSRLVPGKTSFTGDNATGFGDADGGGKDVVRGGADIDVLYGDNFVGAGGENTGGARHKLFGDDGGDFLLAGPGNDARDGGANADECDGGPGSNDTGVRCETESNIEGAPRQARATADA